jgi:hypothetical protein
VSRRIRHWTNERLIPTEGDTHSGKGRHRHYGLKGLLVAATLWELSRYNLPVGVLEEIVPLITETAEEWEFEVQNGNIMEIMNYLADKWCVISHDTKTGDFQCVFVEEEGHPVKQLTFPTQQMESASAIILNMEKIGECVTKP